MRKKLLIILAIMVILLILIWGYSNLNNSSSNEIKVGSAQFNMPNGFKIDQKNSTKEDIVLTNGSNVIHLSSFDGKYATPYINSYINATAQDGQSVSNVTLKINDLLVYRFENNNASAIHEWFVYNNKVYTIYCWGDTQNFDGISFELIESIN